MADTKKKVSTKKKVTKKVVKPVVKKETKEPVKITKESDNKTGFDVVERTITPKNYVIVAIGLIITVLLTFIIRSIVMNYKINVSSVSVFSENVDQINLSDLDYAIAEVGEAIIYVSYTGDSGIKRMEKKLYATIEDKGIKERIIYLDVTDIKKISDKKDNKYINILKEKFPTIKNQINAVPMFIYVKDGIAIEALSSELKMIDYKVLNKLIEKYEIE